MDATTVVLDRYYYCGVWTDTAVIVAGQIPLQWCQHKYYCSGVRTNTTTVVSGRILLQWCHSVADTSTVVSCLDTTTVVSCLDTTSVVSCWILLQWCLDRDCYSDVWKDTAIVVSGQLLLLWCWDEYYCSGFRKDTPAVVSGWKLLECQDGYYCSGVGMDTVVISSNRDHQQQQEPPPGWERIQDALTNGDGHVGSLEIRHCHFDHDTRDSSDDGGHKQDTPIWRTHTHTHIEDT